MSPQRKRPTLEDRLDQLSALRQNPDAPETLEELQRALTGRENLLTARAARVAGDLGKDELVPHMLAAFERCMDDPLRTDKGCHAKTEIAKALLALEHSDSELFLRGVRHVQLEGAYGGPVDVAIELRANCALGLVNSGHPDAVLELVPLLLDEGLPVRLAAAQGISASGQLAAEAVLRFKVMTGDEEPEVLTECLTGLLRIAPRRSLEFSRPLLKASAPRPVRLERPLDGQDGGAAAASARRQAAILALGESRLEEAVPLLKEQWESSYDRESRRLVLLALMTSRRQGGIDFLLSLVAEGEAPDAREAVTALAVHRHDEALRARAEEAVARSADAGELRRHFEHEFS